MVVGFFQVFHSEKYFGRQGKWQTAKSDCGLFMRLYGSQRVFHRYCIVRVELGYVSKWKYTAYTAKYVVLENFCICK